MDNAITITVEEYTRLCAADFALKLLSEHRFAPNRQDITDAVLDAFRKEEAKKC